MLAAAQRAGARIVKPAADTFWGGYSGYFADPDGFLWEVAWNPHFWIGNVLSSTFPNLMFFGAEDGQRGPPRRCHQ